MDVNVHIGTNGDKVCRIQSISLDHIIKCVGVGRRKLLHIGFSILKAVRQQRLALYSISLSPVNDTMRLPGSHFRHRVV